jgi:hypothetical protein
MLAIASEINADTPPCNTLNGCSMAGQPISKKKIMSPPFGQF